MSRFLIGMVFGAVLMYAAMHYHVVRGDEGVFLVPKISNNLSDVYVDIREFTLQDWRDHKPLAAAIMRSDRSHLIGDASMDSFRRSVGNLVDQLFSAIGIAGVAPDPGPRFSAVSIRSFVSTASSRAD